MVARKQDAEAREDRPVKRAFDAWRHGLWHVGNASRGTADSVIGGVTQVRRGSGSPLRHPSVLVLGLICLVGGAVARAFTSAPTGLTTETVVLATGTVVWAAVRHATLVFSTRSLPCERRDVTASWAAGLIPMALGVSPWLAPVAWLTSGIATGAALGLFVGRGPAAKATAQAWGIQLAFEALLVSATWFVMNLWVLFLASG